MEDASPITPFSIKREGNVMLRLAGVRNLERNAGGKCSNPFPFNVR
jgi:hypothetical protein